MKKCRQKQNITIDATTALIKIFVYKKLFENKGNNNNKLKEA